MSDQDMHAGLSGAYVLDALEADEAQRFEAHLAGCAECRREVKDLRITVDLLPLSADAVEPPAGLKARVLAEIAGERDALAPLTVLRGGLQQRPSAAGSLAWMRRRASLVAVTAAAVIAGLAVWNVRLQQQLHNNPPVAAGYYRVVAQALAHGANVSSISGTSLSPSTSGALIRPRGSGAAYLVVHGLHLAPPHKVYELWLIKGSTERRASVFSSSGQDPQIVRLSTGATGYSETAITVEPGPNGSTSPTTQPLLTGRLTA
ncbi:MAG: anti-sigma factor [Pseudonocardiaceae bacterium]